MRFITRKIKEQNSDTIICFIFENDNKKSETFKYIDELSNGLLSKQIYECETITGKFQETFKFAINENLKVLIVGLGKKEEFTRQKFSQCIALAARTAKTLSKNKSIAIETIENCCQSTNINKKDIAQITLTSARIGLYQFDKYVADKNKIETIELTKIYRQKDRSFIELLGRIRSNNLTDEDLHNLNLCCRPPEKDNGFVIHLATTNRLADEINKSRLAALEGHTCLSQAVVDGNFAPEYYPAAEILELKPDAQIMFLNNDVKKRWVNGTLGKIETIRLNEDKIRFLRIRLENSGKIVDVFPYTWEIYKYSLVGKEIVSDIAGSFTQYPLRLAWAVTIHKSQGKTFDHILLDVGSGTFAPGQLYVALSRCTSLNGIRLAKPLQKRHVLTDERINLFMRRCLTPAVPPTDKAALFEQAALRRQKLKIEYRRQDGQISHRVIIPLRIKGENLLAFCTQRQEQRSFNLQRILRITPFYE